MKLWYYVKNAGLGIVPKAYFINRKKTLEEKYADRSDYIEERVKYYVNLEKPFSLPENAIQIKRFKYRKQSEYFFDLKAFLYYFPSSCRFNYHFGDETHIEPHPTIFKARPIHGENSNSVLFKLKKRRHFKYVNDSLAFHDKKDMAVFRGAVYQSHRKYFIERFWNHPLCEAGQTNTPKEDVPWQKPFMSIAEQLKYKFILCLEGNDVASNLKWAMSSNSTVITPKMKFETWFMEGMLEADKHYIEVKEDYSDLEDKINHYIDHPDEAEAIIQNAHDFQKPFRDKDLEDLICIKVLERYFQLSGQL